MLFRSHYYRYLKGEKTSTNPIATIFAWTGALAKRAELDNLPDLAAFAAKIESACMEILSGGGMTKDLSSLTSPDFPVKVLNTEEFIDEIAKKL